MRLGIIDLGTNTFNLLIIDIIDNNTINTVYKSNLPVKLGKGGINNKTITKEAFDRGIEAISFHKKSLTEHKVENIFAYATSAIRSADNGDVFVKRIKSDFDININVISGETEANLIYQGVKNAINLTEEIVLILDIGGGSSEFIIANKNKVFWRKSFELGIARLIDLFNPSNPIKSNEIILIESYLDSSLHGLFNELDKYKIKTLIGSSGSFDTFASMISTPLNLVKTNNQTFFKISIHEFNYLNNKLINSTFEERANMEGLEPMRIEMIVVASIFTNFIIKKLNIEQIIQSEYAIKEGIAFNYIENQFKISI